MFNRRFFVIPLFLAHFACQTHANSLRAGAEIVRFHFTEQSMDMTGSGLHLGYDLRLASRFSITGTYHIGTGLHVNAPYDYTDRLIYYWSWEAKFNLWLGEKRQTYIYLAPSWNQMSYTKVEEVKRNKNVAGAGGSVGFGAFITDHILVDISIARHQLNANHDAQITSDEPLKPDLYTFAVIYSF